MACTAGLLQVAIKRLKPILLVAFILSIFFLLLFKLFLPRNVHFDNFVHFSDDHFDFRNISPFYRRRHPYNCKALFEADPEEITRSHGESGKKPSTGAQKPFQIWTSFADCDEIHRRFYYPQIPLSMMEGNFSLAFAILVDSDLEQVELLLNALYAPQNVYCFHIDLKAPYLFHSTLERLASCFRNVFILPERYSVTSVGQNMIRAYLACLRLLSVESPDWRYAFTLQGHDFPLRTNRELVQILTMHDGANDVELLATPGARAQIHFEWTFDNETGWPIGLDKMKGRASKSAPPDGLTIYKGSVAVALSRAFIDFTLTSPTARRLVTWLDDVYFADELYWSTLNHDETLAAPGGYPGSCLGKNGLKMWISRFTVWESYTHLWCKGYWRHFVCVFSAADLAALAKRPELIVNKLIFGYDQIAAYCMHELLFNRTYMSRQYPSEAYGFNRSFYQSLSAVQYHQWKQSHSHVNILDRFPCVICQNCQH